MTYRSRGSHNERSTLRVSIQGRFGSLKQIEAALDIDVPALLRLA